MDDDGRKHPSMKSGTTTKSCLLNVMAQKEYIFVEVNMHTL